MIHKILNFKEDTKMNKNLNKISYERAYQMEGYKTITREELVQILQVFRDCTVLLSVFNFVKGSVIFEKFDFRVYTSKNNQIMLSLTSEEMENCWNLELEEIEEIMIDEDIQEYNYAELSGNQVILKYFNGLIAEIVF